MNSPEWNTLSKRKYNAYSKYISTKYVALPKCKKPIVGTKNTSISKAVNVEARRVIKPKKIHAPAIIQNHGMMRFNVGKNLSESNNV